MEIEVNFIAVIACVVASMAIGFVWYGPLLGKKWSQLVGLTEEQMKEASPKALGIAVVSAFIKSYVLATFIFIFNDFNGNSYLQDALLVSLIAWIGFLATQTVMTDSFERRSLKLTVINLGYDFISLLTFGLIIGLIGV